MNQFAMIREATSDDLDVLARIIREKIDIRVGTIVLVEDVLGAEKLVRLIVAALRDRRRAWAAARGGIDHPERL